jgi:hypothetical protein
MQQNKLEERSRTTGGDEARCAAASQTAYLRALYEYRQKKLRAAEAAIQEALSMDPANLIPSSCHRSSTSN